MFGAPDSKSTPFSPKKGKNGKGKWKHGMRRASQQPLPPQVISPETDFMTFDQVKSESAAPIIFTNKASQRSFDQPGTPVLDTDVHTFVPRGTQGSIFDNPTTWDNGAFDFKGKMRARPKSMIDFKDVRAKYYTEKTETFVPVDPTTIVQPLPPDIRPEEGFYSTTDGFGDYSPGIVRSITAQYNNPAVRNIRRIADQRQATILKTHGFDIKALAEEQQKWEHVYAQSLSGMGENFFDKIKNLATGAESNSLVTEAKSLYSAYKGKGAPTPPPVVAAGAPIPQPSGMSTGMMIALAGGGVALLAIVAYVIKKRS
jgi:hypothetical protein